MGPASSKQLSGLLLHWGHGDRQALEAILPLVYNELRRLAHYHLKQQRPNHTLQTTALVHEAYLRLAHEKCPEVENRTHFLGIAAQLMRWILVDYERKRRAAKRGAGVTRVTLDPSVVAGQENQDVDLLALDEALNRLAKLDSQQSQIIELRYFGGLLGHRYRFAHDSQILALTFPTLIIAKSCGTGSSRKSLGPLRVSEERL